MHIHTTAPDGSYEKLAVSIDTDSSVYHVINSLLKPIGMKLDKEIGELREKIAKLSTKVTPISRGSTPRSQRKQRKQRKTRKSRK